MFITSGFEIVQRDGRPGSPERLSAAPSRDRPSFVDALRALEGRAAEGHAADEQDNVEPGPNAVPQPPQADDRPVAADTAPDRPADDRTTDDHTVAEDPASPVTGQFIDQPPALAGPSAGSAEPDAAHPGATPVAATAAPGETPQPLLGTTLAEGAPSPGSAADRSPSVPETADPQAARPNSESDYPQPGMIRPTSDTGGIPEPPDLNRSTVTPPAGPPGVRDASPGMAALSGVREATAPPRITTGPAAPEILHAGPSDATASPTESPLRQWTGPLGPAPGGAFVSPNMPAPPPTGVSSTAGSPGAASIAIPAGLSGAVPDDSSMAMSSPTDRSPGAAAPVGLAVPAIGDTLSDGAATPDLRAPETSVPPAEEVTRVSLFAAADGARGTAAPSPAAPHVGQSAAPPSPAVQIVQAVAEGGQALTEITLSPEELGRVRIGLTMQHGAIAVTILADRPETTDLMRRHLDQLGQEFRALGFHDVTFSFGSEGGSGRQAAAPTLASDLGADPPDAVASPSGRPVVSHGHLDLRL